MAETPVTYRGTVYPWQCDHIGHMNVMWYVGKFDEATWNLFAEVGMTPTYLRNEGRGMAAVQQNITYKRELLAGYAEVVKYGLIDDPAFFDWCEANGPAVLAGDAEKRMIIVEYGLKIRQQKAHGVIRDLNVA